MEVFEQELWTPALARNPGQREAAGAKSTSSREGLEGCHLTTSTDAQTKVIAGTALKVGSTVVRASGIVIGSAIVVIASAVVTAG
jgi:hypothetical protein